MIEIREQDFINSAVKDYKQKPQERVQENEIEHLIKEKHPNE